MKRLNISRRDAIRMGVGASCAFAAGCHTDSIFVRVDGDPRLSAVPHAPTQTVPLGHSTVDVADPYRHVHLFVPTGYRPTVPRPLVILYHGTGGSGGEFLDTFAPWADASRVILAGASAFAGTWDAVLAKFGPDVDFTNLMLSATFDFCNVDPTRIGVLGFSSGATYALAMGMANGDLFTRVAAFSPGNLLGVAAHGDPEFFVTHGTQDQIYTIDSSSRPIVKELRKHYKVDYREFEGGHTASRPLVDVAMPWLAAAR